MSDKDFLKRKSEYVKDVLAILEKRAAEEAELIFKRHREAGGKKLYSEISMELSKEINVHYARFFDFFSANPDLVEKQLYRKVMLNHMPEMVRDDPKLRAKAYTLPFKIKCAILASEIGSFIVYQGGWDEDLEGRLNGYLKARLD